MKLYGPLLKAPTKLSYHGLSYYKLCRSVIQDYHGCSKKKALRIAQEWCYKHCSISSAPSRELIGVSLIVTYAEHLLDL